MPELLATSPGLFPLPDWAKDRLSDQKGHQKHDLISGDEGEETVETYEEARSEAIDRQRDAGLDLIGEGQLRWDDMLAHPLAVHDNVETRGIVRYYDNNNFYRDPVVTGDLTFDGDVAAELEAAVELRSTSRQNSSSSETAAAAETDSLQAVLPGPYSLADLATDEHYGDEAEFLDAVADFLVGEAEAFPDVETLFLLEPSLVENAPGDGVDERASEAVDAVANAVDAEVVAHTYWGALDEKVYAHLLDADVDAVGFDFVADQADNLYNINEYGATDDVALGLVNGQNTLMEDADAIRERVEWVDEQTPGADFGKAYLTANAELFYLPYSEFEQKLQALADAASAQEVKA